MFLLFDMKRGYEEKRGWKEDHIDDDTAGVEEERKSEEKKKEKARGGANL